jgi:hypothetical protein
MRRATALALGASVTVLVILACRHGRRRTAPAGLSIGSVPTDDDPWDPDVVRFALSFDGYEAFGGIGPLAGYANEWRERWVADGRLPDDVAGLRACLFFEQRRHHHFGRAPEGDDAEYVRCLLWSIRTAVSGGDPGAGR